MSRCSTSTDHSSRAHTSRSEPRGLSHILNPSSSGETKQHVVSGRPFGAYEENGRLYHSWRRGIYPYPTDEVSTMPQVQSHRPMKLTPGVARTKPIRYGASSCALHHPRSIRRIHTNTQWPDSAASLGQSHRQYLDNPIQHCRYGMRQWYLGVRYGEVSGPPERCLLGNAIADIVVKPISRR
jgi:hypothetical protein